MKMTFKKLHEDIRQIIANPEGRFGGMGTIWRDEMLGLGIDTVQYYWNQCESDEMVHRRGWECDDSKNIIRYLYGQPARGRWLHIRRKEGRNPPLCGLI
jgi:hypothetical protein